MKVAEALRRGAGTLRLAGIDDAEIEAEILLRHALGLSRAHLLLAHRDDLDADGEREFLALLRQRATHVPCAYLTGLRGFYDIELAVAPGVLIPRPETEHVVEVAREVAGQMLTCRDRITLVDVGTGSGAIALALAKHLPAVRVLATDCSEAALAMAGLNARRLRLAGRVTLLSGDLLDPVHEPVDIVTANLPYVPSAVIPTLAPEVRDHEPRQALDGGPDGLRVIGRLLRQASHRLTDHGAIVLEIGHDQAAALVAEASEALPGSVVEIRRDLAGLDRVAIIRP
ncbi:MAG: peptide chain release factor N(5)-glutamine methyltransferase [Dehalococcoidia bacterium]